MNIRKTTLPGLLLIEPKVFKDERGWFYESYHEEQLAKQGLKQEFIQDNHSRSSKSTVRGIHFQIQPGQAKLVRCTLGAVWDVAVDLRRESPTFGQWEGFELSAENKLQVFIPIGFGHGFCVTSDWAEVQYKCSAYYDAKTESGIRWNDPQLNITWPITNDTAYETANVSERDKKSQSYAEFVASGTVIGHGP